METSSDASDTGSEMDLQRQVRELREEQEKTTEQASSTTVSPTFVPEEEREDYCEGQPMEDFNFLETHINVDEQWPSFVNDSDSQ